MTIECPECKDRSKFCTDSYIPLCGIIQNEVDRCHFELLPCRLARNRGPTREVSSTTPTGSWFKTISLRLPIKERIESRTQWQQFSMFAWISGY